MSAIEEWKNKFKKPSGEYADEFEYIDLHFADYAAEQASAPDAEILWTSALLASRAVRKGDTCADFNEIKTYLKAKISVEEWKNELAQHPDAVSVVDAAIEIEKIPPAPLVFWSKTDEEAIYLQRYFSYETIIAERLKSYLKNNDSKYCFKGENIAELVTCFTMNKEKRASFQGDNSAQINYQHLAVFNGIHRNFSVVTGGPGTGKTTVLSAILAFEILNAHNLSHNLNIALAAPTGKAVARMKDSVDSAIQNFISYEKPYQSLLQEKFQNLKYRTLHGLLRIKEETHQSPYNQKNPLTDSNETEYDLIVIDECSMVSLPLFASFFAAITEKTRLILLGDQNQLSSVETGTVMADICESGKHNIIGEHLLETFKKEFPGKQAESGMKNPLLPLDGVITGLKVNYRSKPAIHQAGEAVKNYGNTGYDNEAAFRSIVSSDPEHQNYIFMDYSKEHFNLSVELEIVLSCERKIQMPDGTFVKCSYKDLPKMSENFSDAHLYEIFALMDSFKILAALNSGPYGVDRINELAMERLKLEKTDGRFPPGTPIMILKNDRRTGLRNGDTGIVVKDKNDRDLVYFNQKNKTEYIHFDLNKLPEHQAVFAMTIHKSQGSGFDDVLLILPPYHNMNETARELLSRELLYTGITRAKERLKLWGDLPGIRYALEHKTAQISRLKSRLEIQ